MSESYTTARMRKRASRMANTYRSGDSHREILTWGDRRARGRAADNHVLSKGDDGEGEEEGNADELHDFYVEDYLVKRWVFIR